MESVVVGITGASGIILGCKMAKALSEKDFQVELVVTSDAQTTATIELKSSIEELLKDFSSICYHTIDDFTAPVASGSFPTRGMVIIPCSMTTLAAISCGLGNNLLCRAADVTLKERRPLVIVPRETPLSEIHLRNMLDCTRAGATIVPPVPAWYNDPKTLDDVENFIVGRALDALHITTDLYTRWHQIG